MIHIIVSFNIVKNGAQMFTENETECNSERDDCDSEKENHTVTGMYFIPFFALSHIITGGNCNHILFKSFDAITWETFLGACKAWYRSFILFYPVSFYCNKLVQCNFKFYRCRYQPASNISRKRPAGWCIFFTVWPCRSVQLSKVCTRCGIVHILGDCSN